MVLNIVKRQPGLWDLVFKLEPNTDKLLNGFISQVKGLKVRKENFKAGCLVV